MKSLYHIVSSAGGLVSPKLDARTDQAKYGSWLRQCRNLIPYRSGALTRAPGTQMISKTLLANGNGHNYAGRLIPFTFSPSTQFMLEFGDHYIRFYSNGQKVTVSSAPTWMIGIYYQPGSFVTDPTDHLIYYTKLGSGNDAQPHADPVNWVQQTLLEAFTPYGADAGAGSIYDTDIFAVTPCQINDVVYLTHPDYPPWKLTSITNVNWTMSQVDFITPALLDQNASNTMITPSELTGTIELTASAPAWVASNFYQFGNTVEVSGVIYSCIVTHVSSASFANDLQAGDWQQIAIFNALHVGSTWQLAVLRSSSYIEYDGDPTTGFADGTSSTIQCLGAYEIHTYGVWSSDVAIQRSLDSGLTWTTITTVTSRSDNNADITGTADVLGLYRIVVSNSAGSLINAGATVPRIVFECVDAFLDGLVKITEYLTPYTVIADVVSQLSDSNPLAAQWVSGQAYTAGDQASYNFINYTAANDITSATPPPQDVTNWTPNQPGGTVYWSEAAWSDYRGYPRAVTTFQQRIIYASSGFEPQRIWGTKTNDLENLDLGDQTLATDGFAFDLNAPGRGPILWLIAQTDLFAGFSGAEWIINAGNTNNVGASAGGAITATNINAVEQGTFGSAPNVQPTIVGNAVFFTQRQADAIRQMLFSVYTAKYMSQDLTALADNLFSSGIVHMAYQSRWRHQGILWVVTRQGSMCGLTYDLDQEIFGWCERFTGAGQTDPVGNDIPDDNGFESAAVLYANNSSDDEVWVVANRLISGVPTRFIERVNPNNWEENFTGAPNPPAPLLSMAYYMDCGLTITPSGVFGGGGTAAFTVIAGQAAVVGIDYLNGRYVVGLADGNAFGPLLVSGGTIILPPSIPSQVFTLSLGLPISYAGQPMRIDSDPKAGNTQALVKQIDDVYVRVWNSMGGAISNGTDNYQTWISGQSYSVGENVISPLTQGAFQCVAATNSATDPSESISWQPTSLPFFRQPVPIPYANAQNIPFAQPKLVTVPTEIRIKPHGDMSPSSDPVFIVSGNDPLPLTVLAIGVKYDITGKP